MPEIIQEQSHLQFLLIKTNLQRRVYHPNNGRTSVGNVTDDHIYLLSIDEATALDSGIRNCGSVWWLRSPGYDSYIAAFVNVDGDVFVNGSNVNLERGVRPALTLHFE